MLVTEKQMTFGDEIPEYILKKAKPIRLQTIKEKVFGDKNAIYKFWGGDSWCYSTYLNNPFSDELVMEVFKKLES